VDEKVVEEIRMHQETIANDGNSPLHLIREKELEISGRVLTAKRQADGLVGDARKKAAEIVGKAEQEGGSGAADREVAIREQSRKEAEALKTAAKSEAAELSARIDSRRKDAVRLVLDAVTSV
jgi:vacuolar-type H+-ATPase subunit H